MWHFRLCQFLQPMSVCGLMDVFSVLSKHLRDFSEDEAHILRGKKKLYCNTEKKSLLTH